MTQPHGFMLTETQVLGLPHTSFATPGEAMNLVIWSLEALINNGSDLLPPYFIDEEYRQQETLKVDIQVQIRTWAQHTVNRVHDTLQNANITCRLRCCSVEWQLNYTCFSYI